MGHPPMARQLHGGAGTKRGSSSLASAPANQPRACPGPWSRWQTDPGDRPPAASPRAVHAADKKASPSSLRTEVQVGGVEQDLWRGMNHEPKEARARISVTIPRTTADEPMTIHCTFMMAFKRSL